MWIFSFWVDCFRTQGGRGSAKIWWRAHPPVTQAGSTLLLFVMTHFLKGVLKELWGISRAKVIQGRRGCYSTEHVGTYWHSTHKETGKNCGQGFTLGSSYHLLLENAPAGSSSTALGPLLKVNADTPFQRPVKGLLSSANRTGRELGKGL